ncbi:phosphatase PAP2 family protein [Sphingosinicellaceae bacterium]|nr:phosphatase PAP2 family protein [Sphingosinicellaceae bacterium]
MDITSQRLAESREWSAIGLAYALVGLVLAIDLVVSVYLGLSIGHWWLPIPLSGSLLILSAAYRRRSPGIAQTAELGALWIAFIATSCILSYLSATLAFPLKDALLERMDRAIGFDWEANRALVIGSPVAHLLLFGAYVSLLPQILLSIVYFPARGQGQRSAEFILLAMLALFPTCVVSALCPAVGPLAVFLPNQAVHLHDLLALRASGPWHFDLPAMEGIVSMPSYHAALAVLFTYTFRRSGVLGWLVAGLNVLMLLSVPPIGGHYLVDLVGGIIVALGCILVVRHVLPGDDTTLGTRPRLAP